MFLSRNNPCHASQTHWLVCWKPRPPLFRMFRTARKGLAEMVIAMSVDPAHPMENDGTVIGRTSVAAISLVAKSDETEDARAVDVVQKVDRTSDVKKDETVVPETKVRRNDDRKTDVRNLEIDRMANIEGHGTVSVARATAANPIGATKVVVNGLREVRDFDEVKHRIRDLAKVVADAKLLVEVSKGVAVRGDPKDGSRVILAGILANTAVNETGIEHRPAVGHRASVLRWLVDLSEDMTDAANEMSVSDPVVRKVVWHFGDLRDHAVLVAERVLHQEVIAEPLDRACNIGGREVREVHRWPSEDLDLNFVAA